MSIKYILPIFLTASGLGSAVTKTNKVIKNPEEVLKRVNAAMENVFRSYRIETSERETFEGFNS